MLEGINQGFLSEPPKEYIKDINIINKKKKPVIQPKPVKKEEKRKGLLNFRKNKNEGKCLL